TFANGSVALSITNLTLDKPRLYQGIYNDGNATLIQLSPIHLYSATFQETGLPVNTPWSVTMNGTTSSSSSPNITMRLREANYAFRIGGVPGYVADYGSGSFNLNASTKVSVRFTSTRALELAASERNILLLLTTSVAAWSIVGIAAVVTRRRAR